MGSISARAETVEAKEKGKKRNRQEFGELLEHIPFVQPSDSISPLIRRSEKMASWRMLLKFIYKSDKTLFLEGTDQVSIASRFTWFFCEWSYYTRMLLVFP